MVEIGKEDIEQKYYIALISEINELKDILKDLPEENIIERKGFEYRLARRIEEMIRYENNIPR